MEVRQNGMEDREGAAAQPEQVAAANVGQAAAINVEQAATISVRGDRQEHESKAGPGEQEQSKCRGYNRNHSTPNISLTVNSFQLGQMEMAEPSRGGRHLDLEVMKL